MEPSIRQRISVTRTRHGQQGRIYEKETETTVFPTMKQKTQNQQTKKGRERKSSLETTSKEYTNKCEHREPVDIL